jgi:hypothetical protein
MTDRMAPGRSTPTAAHACDPRGGPVKGSGRISGKCGAVKNWIIMAQKRPGFKKKLKTLKKLLDNRPVLYQDYVSDYRKPRQWVDSCIK